MYNSVSQALKCNSFAVLTNKQNQSITVSYYYHGSEKKYLIIFCKQGEIARQGAINTVSEKKVLKIINEGNYE